MKVRQLLDSPEKWVKGNLALTSDGNRANPRDVEAARFCLWGAVYRCYENAEQFQDALLRIRVEFIGMGVNQTIDNWNDAQTTTFEDVKQLVNELDI